jgi:hypothetical protein
VRLSANFELEFKILKIFYGFPGATNHAARVKWKSCNTTKSNSITIEEMRRFTKHTASRCNIYNIKHWNSGNGGGGEDKPSAHGSRRDVSRHRAAEILSISSIIIAS